MLLPLFKPFSVRVTVRPGTGVPLMDGVIVMPPPSTLVSTVYPGVGPAPGTTLV